MYLRHEKKFNSQISLSEPIGFDQEGNEISLMDILIGDGEDVCEKVDRSEKLKKLFEKVRAIKDAREKEIIYLRYGLSGGEPMTQKEVAKKMGISRSYVSRIEKKAISHLRES
ncbi:MAG: sigma-70 family RNA polymerase sigma factor [Clostridia bacterium]|nr:sigma-70 family RNA polymerase sigma factor [Clostridia bacterium]